MGVLTGKSLLKKVAAAEIVKVRRTIKRMIWVPRDPGSSS